MVYFPNAIPTFRFNVSTMRIGLLTLTFDSPSLVIFSSLAICQCLGKPRSKRWYLDRLLKLNIVHSPPLHLSCNESFICYKISIFLVIVLLYYTVIIKVPYILRLIMFCMRELNILTLTATLLGRNLTQQGLMRLLHVPSSNQLADMFTKPLSPAGGGVLAKLEIHTSTKSYKC